MNLIDWLRANYNLKYKLVADIQHPIFGYFLLDPQSNEYPCDAPNLDSWADAVEEWYGL